MELGLSLPRLASAEEYTGSWQDRCSGVESCCAFGVVVRLHEWGPGASLRRGPLHFL